MKKYLLALLALSLSLSAWAQGSMQFEKRAHNFGQIKEEAGPVTYRFAFKNSGDKPLTISSVQTSCGCTAPQWSKEAVAPGAEGFVSATYDPRNRPGKFSKTIQVGLGAEQQPITLVIEGEVVAAPQGPKDLYPMEVGNLRFKTTHIVFGNVLHDQQDTASVVLYNQGQRPITLKLQEVKLPAHLKLSSDHLTVEPSKTATLLFTYDAKLKNDWGYIFEFLSLPTSDHEQPDKRIYLSANIKERFAKNPKGGAPKISFDKTTHNFGEMMPGKQAKASFTIRNEGQKPLMLRKVKPSCGCTAIMPNKTTLAPGESTTLDVTFTASTHPGTSRKSITVIANDPTQDETTLWIESNVGGEDEDGGDE